MVSDPLVTPFYLVELGFTPTLYLSSGPTITWDGHTWVAAPLEVSQINLDITAEQTTSLRIANHDRSIGAILLNESAQDKPVKIWLNYDDPAFTPVLMSEGQMDGAQIGEFIELAVISRSTAYGSTPRIICSPPLFNHLPPPGTVIKHGTRQITIEVR